MAVVEVRSKKAPSKVSAYVFGPAMEKAYGYVIVTDSYHANFHERCRFTSFQSLQGREKPSIVRKDQICSFWSSYEVLWPRKGGAAHQTLVFNRLGV